MLIQLGRSAQGAIGIASQYANRHGLITGATGSGKSVTVARLIESFSNAGVPCFVADVKGDLAGMAMPGTGAALPVDLIDVFGVRGRAAHLSFANMGADLTARALDLSPAQSGVLDIVFAAAQRYKWRLLTVADLQAALSCLEQSPAKFSEYGRISSASVAVIRRALLRLDTRAFGAPQHVPLVMATRKSSEGRGTITILSAEYLIQSPVLYAATIMTWLSDLYERLPERGDRAVPLLAFFMDESHLLFADLPTPLLRRFEQIVRLIRSKGVALFFASQSPDDIPAVIAGQLANRIQHAMRAVTPRDLAAVRAAADSMPSTPGLDAVAAIGGLRPGQALASLVGADGSPSRCAIVQVALPACRVGTITAQERARLIPTAQLRGDKPASPAPGGVRGLLALIDAFLGLGLRRDTSREGLSGRS